MSTQVLFSCAVIIVTDNSAQLSDCICDLKFWPPETIFEKETFQHSSDGLLLEFSV